jgi:hypothetical protein
MDNVVYVKLCFVTSIGSNANGWKAHYIVHKMLPQVSFCKILKFVIGHVNK